MHEHNCTRLLLIAIIGIGVMARLTTASSPVFDFHSWRQADTASIARNFLEERFNPLYPQIDQRGNRVEGYVETGFELYAFVVAAISQVIGFSPATGRILNTLLFPLAALLLFRFVRERYGLQAGIVGVFIYALGMPLVVYIDRAFMNESMLIFLSIVCLRSTQEYLRRRATSQLAVLIIASTLIAVVKPTFLIVWAPVGGLFLEQFGRRVFLRPEIWLMCGVNAAMAALWFRHAHGLYEMTGLTFGIDDKLFDPTYLRLEYFSKVVVRLFKDILGPVGCLFGGYGLVAALKSGKFAEALGVAGFIVYLFVVTPGNFHHNYYQLPIVVAVAPLTALGVTAAVSRLGSRRAWTDDRRLNAYAIILGIAVLTTFIRSVSAHNWYEVNQQRAEICASVAGLLGPHDRIAFVNDLSPDILFCVDRKGWLLNTVQSQPEGLQHLVRQGARVFVTERTYPDLVASLDAIAPRAVETRTFVAHRVP